MVAVFGLIDYKEAIHLWKSNRTDFWMLTVTFSATLTLGIELGIGVGVILSLAMVIFRSTRPHIAVLGKVPGTNIYRNVDRFADVKEREDLLIFRFDAPLYFANINYFKDKLEEEIARKGIALKALIFPANSMYELDSSAVHTLEEVINDCRNRGIQIYFSGVRGPVRDAMMRGHLTEKIGEQNFFMNIRDAVEFHDGQGNETGSSEMKDYVLQVNK